MRTAILDDYRNVPSEGGAGTESWGKQVAGELEESCQLIHLMKTKT
jgi:hypothetical protein